MIFKDKENSSKNSLISLALITSMVLAPVSVFSILPKKADAQQGLAGVSGYVSGLGPAIARLPQCKDTINKRMKSLFDGVGDLFRSEKGKTEDLIKDVDGDIDFLEVDPTANIDGERIEDVVKAAKSETTSVQVNDPEVVKSLREQGKALNKINKETEALNQNSSCIASIGRLMIKMLLQKLTVSTVKWINGGFDGSPAFIQDPGKFFGDIAKSEILQFGLEIDDDTRFPFGKEWLRNTATAFNKKFQDNAQYSLNELIQNTTPEYSALTFSADFSQGGWNAWTALTQVPANNPLGFKLLADNEIQKRLVGTSQTRAQDIRDALETADGFLGDQRCVEPEGITREQHEEAVKQKNKEGMCQKWEYVTPGKLIAQAATNAFDYPNNALLNVQDLNDAVAAILDAVMGQMFPMIMEKGFSALEGDSSSGQLVFRDSGISEPYRTRTEKDFSPVHLSSSWLKSNPNFNIRTDLTQALIDEQRTYIDKLEKQNKELFSTTDGKDYKLNILTQSNQGQNFCNRALLGSLCDGFDAFNWFNWGDGTNVNFWYKDISASASGGWSKNLIPASDTSGVWLLGSVVGGTWTATSGTGGVGQATWTRTSGTDTTGSWTSETGSGNWTTTNSIDPSILGGTWTGCIYIADCAYGDGTPALNYTRGTWIFNGLYGGTWTATSGTGGVGQATWTRTSGTDTTGSWTSETGSGNWTTTNSIDPSILGGIWQEPSSYTPPSSNYTGQSNAYGLLPVIYQLDYCIPGPHPGWEDDSRRTLAEVLDVVIPETPYSLQSRSKTDIINAAKSLAPLAGAVIAGALITGTGASAALFGLTIGAAAGPVGIVLGAAIGATIGFLVGLFGGDSPEDKTRAYYATQISNLTSYLPDYKDNNDDRVANILSKNGMVHVMNEILNRYIHIMKQTYFSSPDILPPVAGEAAAAFRQARGYNQMLQNNIDKILLLKTTINLLGEIKGRVDKLNSDLADGAIDETEYEDALKAEINAFGRLSAGMVNGDDIASADSILKQIIDKRNYLYNNLLKGDYGCEASLEKPQKQFPAQGPDLQGPSGALNWGVYNANSVQRMNYPHPIFYDYNSFSKGDTLPDPLGSGYSDRKIPDADAGLPQHTPSYSMYDDGNKYLLGPGFLSFVHFSSEEDSTRTPDRLQLGDLLPMWNKLFNRQRALGLRKELRENADSQECSVCSGVFETSIGVY